MSFRSRMFLLFGALMAAVLAAQWWFLGSMTQSVLNEADNLAFNVGDALVKSLAEDTPFFEELRPAQATVVKREIDLFQTSGSPNEDSLEVLVKEEGFVLDQVKNTSRQDDHSSLPKPVAENNEAKPEAHLQKRFVKEFHWQGEIKEAEEGEIRLILLSHDKDELRFPERLKPNELKGVDASWLVMERAGEGVPIPIPKQELERKIEVYRGRMLFGSVGIFALGLLAAAWLAHRLTKPLRRLQSGAERLGMGELGYQIETGRDLGELNASVAAFNQMSTRLKELDAAQKKTEQKRHLSELGEIAQGLAHTIRNPLNTLGLCVDQLHLVKADQHAEKDALAHTARKQISRIDGWIRSFLTLAGIGQAEPARVDIAAMVRDVVLEASADGAAKVRIKTLCPESGPMLRGVGAELRAVLQALVVNAVEASPINGEVEILVEREPAVVRIRISDQGPGLPESVREKLFTPHITTKPTGSGMGLYLAHRIVTARYNGSLLLADGKPSGTRAEIELPLPTEDDHEST